MPDRPIRFLLVDDIAENLTALEALLRRDGLEIHMAHSAAEALEMMLVQDFQLAFVDVQMPGINGYELAELMRGTERTREVPIIFVTAAERSETRRFRGYEAGGVDYIFKPIDPVILKSKAEVFYRLARQAKDLQLQRDELSQIAHDRDLALASLRAHADNSPLALVECDADLVVRRWSQGAERIFGIPEAQVLGRGLDHATSFSSETLAMLQGWISSPDVLARHTAEIGAAGAEGRIHCELYGSVLMDPANGRASLSLQILDVTERHRAEATRSLLLGELNHRIKNTLANVQAIARQTLRSADDLADFGRRFSGRLQALARAHSILSGVTWSSASLDELLDDQVRAGTLDAERLHRNGPAIGLTPENTLHMALVLHELGTNAAKYGALSRPEGEVHLEWRIDGGELVFVWRESGGPHVVPPVAQGFGSTLVATGIGDNRALVEWRPEGVVWTITIASGFTEAPPCEPVPEAAPLPLAPSADVVAGSRILVIEDEALVAMDLRAGLEEAGASVVRIARTLSDAIAAASAEDIDLALLDGNLGGEPVDEVAGILSHRTIPFCFVSGYGREHLPRNFADTPILAKPFASDTLLSTVRDILSKQVQQGLKSRL
ncbi:response regulator [uncultured Paracoccus sp.]|uniref:response regulator n=1 Tax=uncultured Paracoccus sp. TaxID=189685 RepID=UPI0025CD1F28|nr:response regulator [uncultured Paracoccus sp.]